MEEERDRRLARMIGAIHLYCQVGANLMLA